ncbi:probable 60S ribosomal protein L14 [Hevea brasiliensis]|uniref:probable 60S ribosomal protein L14 n=1 Tax=Hevea brasiliensis TaxID=3981 RepID=UPI0025CEA55D|nr:probable 60S ribosomal protein L14 [Hevea brasiliensis]
MITNIPYSTLYSTYLAPTVRASPDLKMPFKRYMEIRRVALINYGKDYRKLSVIVDVIDHNRATLGTPDLWLRPASRLKARPIVILDPDQSISPVPSPSSDDALVVLRLPALSILRRWAKKAIEKRSRRLS